MRLPALPLALTCVALSACNDQGLSSEAAPNPGTPAISVDPREIALGPVEGGSVETVVVTVRSVGDAALTVESIAFDDRVDGLSLTVGELPTVLPAGSELQAIVTFDAHLARAEGELVVLSDDPVSPRIGVPVTAEADLAWLTIDPNPLDLGVVTPGATAPGQVALRNDGNIDLHVETVVLLADDVSFDEALPLPMTIAPGQSVPVDLTYAPVARGEEQAQLWVASNSWLGDTMGTVLGRGGWAGVSGRICDPSGGDWVVDARVFASIDFDGDGESDWTTETRTDATGRYQLEDVPPGTWLLQVEKGSYSASREIVVPEGGGVYELSEDVCLDPDSVQLAVVTGEYDHVESIITDLGLAYDAYSGTSGLRDLAGDEAALSTYDVIFLNCGDYRGLRNDLDEITPALQRFVEAGGSVYASDWASLVVEQTWPGLVDLYGSDTDFENTAIGTMARIEADVVDTVMAYAIGSTRAEILYDLDAWIVPLGAGANVDVLVRSTVPTFTGTVEDAPLAVRIEEGGRIVFTTFHNEQQITRDMDAALREIILSL